MIRVIGIRANDRNQDPPCGSDALPGADFVRKTHSDTDNFILYKIRKNTCY